MSTEQQAEQPTSCPEFQFAYNHIERLIDRRQADTVFYLSVNTGLLAALGFLTQSADLSSLWWVGALAALLIAGFIACRIWHSIIRHFDTLLDWWYGQLRRLEASKPQDKQLITQEYEDLYTDRKRISATKLMKVLANTLSVLYAFFALGLLLSWLAMHL